MFVSFQLRCDAQLGPTHLKRLQRRCCFRYCLRDQEALFLSFGGLDVRCALAQSCCVTALQLQVLKSAELGLILGSGTPFECKTQPPISERMS